MKSVWVLTTEYNAYDQFGEYFVAVFSEKPTREQLHEFVDDVRYVDLLLTTEGGRLNYDHQWWNLVEHKL